MWQANPDVFGDTEVVFALQAEIPFGGTLTSSKEASKNLRSYSTAQSRAQKLTTGMRM